MVLNRHRMRWDFNVVRTELSQCSVLYTDDLNRRLLRVHRQQAFVTNSYKRTWSHPLHVNHLDAWFSFAGSPAVRSEATNWLSNTHGMPSRCGADKVR
jgi:hypothetical protein